MSEETRMARLGLACAIEPGSQPGLVLPTDPMMAWRRLRDSAVDAAAVRRARSLDLAAIARATERAGLRFVTPEDADWPALLRDLDYCGVVGQARSHAPFGLWVAGRASLAEVTAAAVAVVGSRAATSYGETIASEVGSGLADSGIAVVSGGAFGIDAASHRGALAVGGPTVAVMAGGLTQLYPAGNRALLERIGSDGLLVSEYPPGATVTKHRFLVRNRLISALSLGTCIVEAAPRSGARNTVAWAHALGRPVFAVPGPVTSNLSATPHRLVRDGSAALVTGTADILHELDGLGALQQPLLDLQDRALDQLSDLARAVIETLPASGSACVDDVSLASGLASPDCLAGLAELEAMGRATSCDDGTWQLTGTCR